MQFSILSSKTFFNAFLGCSHFHNGTKLPPVIHTLQPIWCEISISVKWTGFTQLGVSILNTRYIGCYHCKPHARHTRSDANDTAKGKKSKRTTANFIVPRLRTLEQFRHLAPCSVSVAKELQVCCALSRC
jgi:hypothetical protein